MNKTLISTIALFAILSVSCKKLTEVNPVKTDTSTKPVSPNAEVDGWIYDQMKSYYLWEGQMLAKEKTDNKLVANDYFESILVKPGELDRFSWIQEDVAELTASLNGVNKVAGIRTSPFYADEAKTKIALSVAFALKGSPADKAGLKRGDLITQVNGVTITPNNYTTILGTDNLKLTLGEYKGNDIVSSSKSVDLVKAEHQTDPIQFSNVVTVGDRKIGYMVYLQFLSAYDNAMRNEFKSFKDKGINELVLDLRYNGGGYISASNVLSSLIVKDLKPGTLMARQEWNTAITKQQTARYGNDVFDTQWLGEANNLGSLKRVYVLTSKGTASASELVINNLKPYMEVILVGDNTYGKNVGSITLSDDKKRWKWGMQPIVLRTVNSAGKSDYGSKDGFTPDIRVSDNVIPFMPFGDAKETLLAAAIKHMTGSTLATSGARKGFKSVSLLSREYPMENKNLELHDMFVNNIPGEK